MKKLVPIIVAISVMLVLSSFVYAMPIYDEKYENMYALTGPTLADEPEPADEEEIFRVAKYWTEKYNEAKDKDDLLIYYYLVTAKGGMEIFLKEYLSNGGSILKSTTTFNNEKGIFNEVVLDEIISDYYDKKYSEKTYLEYRYDMLISHLSDERYAYTEQDFYEILDNNRIFGYVSFDYDSPDLKFYWLEIRGAGTFLAVSDGEEELYLSVHCVLPNRSDDIVKRYQLLTNEQMVGYITTGVALTHDLTRTKEEKMVNYTLSPICDPFLNLSKIAPSTGGSEVVGIAVLCAGASLLGAVAGAVLSRKKGFSK